MRVCLCVPSRGEWKSGFGQDYGRLIAHTIRHKPEVVFTFLSGTGTLIHDLRNDLARDALKAGVEYILWLDDDMRFPPDALLRLLAHDKDIVGANYTTRTVPPKPTAKKLSADGLDYLCHPSLPTDKGLEEVDGIGFGCVLMKASVFKDLPKPWFSMPYAAHKDCHVGEDIYFCANAGAKGHPTFIDHDLSRQIRHCGSIEYGWNHVDALREAA